MFISVFNVGGEGVRKKSGSSSFLIWALAELGGGGFSWVSDSFPAPTFSLSLASTVFTVSRRV